MLSSCLPVYQMRIWILAIRYWSHRLEVIELHLLYSARFNFRFTAFKDSSFDIFRVNFYCNMDQFLFKIAFSIPAFLIPPFRFLDSSYLLAASPLVFSSTRSMRSKKIYIRCNSKYRLDMLKTMEHRILGSLFYIRSSIRFFQVGQKQNCKRNSKLSIAVVPVV